MDKRFLVALNLKISSAIFRLWGILCVLKGFYDLFLGEPEANLYSSAKWEFVSYASWMRWGGFEASYGVLCVAFGYFLYKISVMIQGAKPDNVSTLSSEK